jgi:hypothetical protein
MDYVDWVERVLYGMVRAWDASTKVDKASTGILYTEVAKPLGFSDEDLGLGLGQPASPIRSAILHGVWDLEALGILSRPIQTNISDFALTSFGREISQKGLPSLWKEVFDKPVEQSHMQVLERLVEKCHKEYVDYADTSFEALQNIYSEPDTEWTKEKEREIRRALMQLHEDGLVRFVEPSGVLKGTTYGAQPRYYGVVRVIRQSRAFSQTEPLRMFYNVRIETHSSKTRDEVRLGLSRDELQAELIEPYEAGQPVFVNGRTIPTEDLVRIRITETELNSNDLLKITRAEQLKSPVIGGRLEWRAAAKGKDVTHEMLKGPISFKRTEILLRGIEPSGPSEDMQQGISASTLVSVPNELPVSGETQTTSGATRPETIRDQIFISYSHIDTAWKDDLLTFLTPHVRNLDLDIWVDTRIKAGDLWRDEIKTALSRAKVAVLLVTANFLNSDFIHDEELPAFLAAAGTEGLKILWIAVSPSGYQETPIAQYQGLNSPSRPLSILRKANRENELVRISKEIASVGKPSIHPEPPSE